MNDNFKQTDIGLIPEDWNVDVIDNHFNVKQGKQLSKKTREGNNQKNFLRTANVFWGKLDLSKLDHMNFTESEEERLKLLYNDLLVCEGGDIGRTAIWRNELEDCYYQNHIHRLRVKNDSVEPYFFMNWMYYGVAISNKYFGMGNRTTIPNLSASRLKSFQFPLPTLPEQKKIAHVLSKIQQAIETQEQIIKITQEIKKALMQKLFTEGLNGEPQKQTEIGLIPESWDVKRIDEVYAFTRKPRNRNFSKYRDVPFIPMDLIPDSGTEANSFIPKDFKDIPSGTYFENGDLLLAKITPSFENGKQGIADINFIFGYATTEVIPIQEIKNLSNIIYLHHYLKKEDIRKTLAGKMEGSTGRQRLPKGVVQASLIPFPNLGVQKKISSILSEFDYKIEFTQNKINNLKELFSCSLNQLMTGQIRVKDIDFKLEEINYH